MTNDRDEIKALRLRLLENGYTPIRNRDKATFLPNWPRIDVTPEVIDEWSRRHSRDRATGLRLQDGLMAIDNDLPRQDVMDAVADVIHDVCPVFDEEDAHPLVRYGSSCKEAWFCRTDEPFTRIHTRSWREPDAGPDDPTFVVEIFGGASSRQFGCFGPHTVAEDGTVKVEYEWEVESPVDVPLADLPVITKDQCFAIADAAEEVFRSMGLEPVPLSQKGENDAVRVYDLTADMVFDCNDGVSRSLDDLRSFLKAGHEGLRCSASWLEGPQAKRPDRCLISMTRSGYVAIHETASGVTHVEDVAEPVGPGDGIDLNRLKELLQEQTDRRRTALKSADDFDTSLTKALGAYAWCPPTGLVVPLWPHSVAEGEKIANFRVRMAKHGYRDPPGPRGGQGKFHNPADAWAQHERLTVVEGVQMRPDQPRPTFKEGGKLWVNAYRPALFKPEVAALGDAEPGFDFLRRLFPDETECELVEQWISFKLRHPHVPMFALVAVAHAQFGTGRNTLGDLMGLMLGESYVQEIPFETFTGRTYQSQYNDWQADTLVVVVSESADADGSQWQAKRNAYERLKLIVDPRPGRRVRVNVKGTHNYYTRTCTSYLIATNHSDALPIPENDRRFCVVTNGDAQPPSYWRELRRWMNVPENVAAFAAALLAKDLSGFDPFNPPLFEGKLQMADESRSGLDEAIAIALEDLPGEVLTTAQVQAKVGEVARSHMLDLPRGMDAERIIRKEISKTLVRLGDSRDSPLARLKEDGVKHMLFVRSKRARTKWRQAGVDAVAREARKHARLDGKAWADDRKNDVRGTEDGASQAVERLRRNLLR